MGRSEEEDKKTQKMDLSLKIDHHTPEHEEADHKVEEDDDYKEKLARTAKVVEEKAPHEAAIAAAGDQMDEEDGGGGGGDIGSMVENTKAREVHTLFLFDIKNLMVNHSFILCNTKSCVLIM